MRAECMLGHDGAECVGRQRVLAAQQVEILRLDGKVEDALLRADGTIALRQQVQIDPGTEADSAAMAAAFTVLKHCYTYSADAQSNSSGGWRFVQPVASS